MKVPFVDLRAMNEEIRSELLAAFNDCLDHSTFVGGAPVENFEQSFAAYCGVNYAAACASGTDALKLALMAAGVQRGMGVITTANTFIATVEAITLLGAVPFFVDIDPLTYHLSPISLRDFLENQCHRNADGQFVEKRTNTQITAILPVHLYGLMADLQSILEIAKEYQLIVIEDAAQAQGAACMLDGNWQKAGSIGKTAGFSFYPAKNLGALGEAGAVTTQDPQVDQNIRLWRDHGSVQKYMHHSPDGWNSRLDALQCAFLNIKLKKLDEWNNKRRQVAGWYQEYLENQALIKLPMVPSGRTHIYHLYVIRVQNRDLILNQLKEKEIACGLHYPIPLHLQKAYAALGYEKGDLPWTERAASEILSLPMFPHMTQEMVSTVSVQLKKCVENLDNVENH